MSDLPRDTRSTSPYRAGPSRMVSQGPAPSGLAEVLERVLDKGLVVAGDIQLNLLDIELITIKVRLLLASADTAQQMGIDWWQHDPFLSGTKDEEREERRELNERLARLERAVAATLPPAERGTVDPEELAALRERAERGVERGTASEVPLAGEGDAADDEGAEDTERGSS